MSNDLLASELSSVCGNLRTYLQDLTSVLSDMETMVWQMGTLDQLGPDRSEHVHRLIVRIEREAERYNDSGLLTEVMGLQALLR